MDNWRCEIFLLLDRYRPRCSCLWKRTCAYRHRRLLSISLRIQSLRKESCCDEGRTFARICGSPYPKPKQTIQSLCACSNHLSAGSRLRRTQVLPFGRAALFPKEIPADSRENPCYKLNRSCVSGISRHRHRTRSAGCRWRSPSRGDGHDQRRDDRGSAVSRVPRRQRPLHRSF